MFKMDVNDTIQNLARALFKGSLSITLQPEEVQNFTWDKQKMFLDLTVNSNLMQKYPINYHFCKLFLKKLICILEPSQEIHDDMYEFLCSVMKTKSESEFYYRHYVVNDKFHNNIIIQETKNMVVNGTTGLKTWEAAFILADWAMYNHTIFANKKILELGSGVGFTGIAIAKNCNVMSMTMSDCHPDVLKTLKNNIDINFSNPSNDINTESCWNNNRLVEVMKLDWNDIEDLKDYDIPDIVIGADIIYDPSILIPLCDILNYYSERNPKLEIYICSIIRNENTFEAFLKKLDSYNFLYQTIDHSENVKLEWDKNVKKRILLIRKISINK